MRRFRKIFYVAALLAVQSPALAGTDPWTYDPNSVALTTDSRLFMVTPQQFGGKPDTQIISTAVTATSGSTAIHTAYAGWTSANVGDYIVVQDAGTPLTTGGIVGVAVATAGTGYTDVPVVHVTSSGGGGGAVGRAYLTAVATPNIQTAGAGCANGTQAFTPISAGLNTQALAVTATVSGGVVTAVNSITTAGSYYTYPGTTGNATITMTGAGCSTNPRFGVSWGVGSIAMKGTGEGYPVSGSGVAVTLTNAYGGPSATLVQRS